MKRLHTLLPACTACLCLLMSHAISAQNRAIGAKSLILDDGLAPTHTVTVNFPGPGAGPASNVNFNFPNFSSTLVPLGGADGQTLRWNNVLSNWETSNLLLNTGNAVWIGGSPTFPTARLAVSQTTPDAGGASMIRGNFNVNPVSAYNFGSSAAQFSYTAGGTGDMSLANVIGIEGSGVVNRSSPNNVGGLIGASVNAELLGSANVNLAAGIASAVLNYGTGTINNAAGVSSSLAGSPGTMQVGYDYYAYNGFGHINNLYGLYIEDLTAGASNTAIYYYHPANPFQVNGNGTVWLGGPPSFVPSSRLDVTQVSTSSVGSMVSAFLRLNPSAPMPSSNSAATFTVEDAGTGNMINTNDEAVVGFANNYQAAPNIVGTLGAGYFSTTNAGSASLTFGTGVEGNISNINSGTISQGFCFRTSWRTSGGNVPNGYGFYASDDFFGHVSNLYGLFIEQQTGGVNNTAIDYNHATNPFVVAGDGRVGIGVNQGSLFADQLSIRNSTTATAQSVGTWGQSNISPAGASSAIHFGLIYDANAQDVGDMSASATTGIIGEGFSYRNGANSIARVFGVDGEAINNGSATIGVADALYGEVVNGVSGTMTNARAISGWMFNSNGCTMNSASIFYAQNPTNAGTMTNLYGLFVEQMTAGANNFAILYNHPTQPFTVTGNGKVGIGTTTPNAGAALHVATTDAIIVPVGSTAQRPSSPVLGMIRFNNTTLHFEGFNGLTWNNLD